MPRAVVLAVVVPVLVALGTLVLAGAGQERALAFPFGAPSNEPAAQLQPGSRACQGPIKVKADFSRVRFQVRAGGGGSPFEVTASDNRTEALLGRGRLAGGSRDRSRPVVTVGQIARGRRIDVCVTNRGGREVALLGSGGDAVPGTTLVVQGRPQNGDLSLDFLSEKEVSTLSLVPEMLRRADLFRPGWSGPWLYWLLAALVALGVPALLLLALRSALPSDAGSPER